MVHSRTMQVTWHAREKKNEAVFSIDCHPTFPLVATGGADSEIKIWRLIEGHDKPTNVEYAFTLTGHTKTVNCVRWSPNGECLATTSDGEYIIYTFSLSLSFFHKFYELLFPQHFILTLISFLISLYLLV
jgi:WD40 repeat protein